jgi:hypothetical protein
MPLSCQDHYRNLYASCGEVLSKSFLTDTTGRHAISHQFIADLRVWHESIASRPENVLLLAAISEYQFSLLAVAIGQYRQAYMSLRLSFELILGCVYYSGNEFKLRLWLKGSQDLVWAALVCPDTGVFSESFVSTFFEELGGSARQYGGIAQKVYRECSEFVHGNAHTHTADSGKLAFQEQTFIAWHEKARSIKLAASFALCSRYVQTLEPSQRAALEPVLLDSVGHIPAVRAVLGAPVEGKDV